MNPQFLSNAYLVCDGRGGPAFLVDAGGPVQPLVDAAERADVTVTHVLVSHHHFDHVSELGAIRERWPEVRVLAHPMERELMAGQVARTAERAGGDSEPEAIQAGQVLDQGELRVLPLHTPGHTAGMLSFLVFEPAKQPRGSAAGGGPGGFQGGEAVVFTGDTLFRGSVGGVRAPGHTTYADLKDSIMGTLMELPAQTVIYPGHTDSTSVGAEWEGNPFIRIWRGVDLEGSDPCTALGEPATLILLAKDYDGGSKAWVRWPDGRDDIVPGSRVQVGDRPSA